MTATDADIAARYTREQRLARLDAVHHAKNLVGRYAFLHACNQHARLLELHALDTAGVRVEVPFGIYEGRDGLERLYLKCLGRLDAEPEGRMHIHTMTTPVIEVGGDLQTAKGVWMSPGNATDKFGGETFQTNWRWVKHAVDFIKEDGEWKIWHMRLHGIFGTSFYKDWVETSREPKRGGPPPMPPELAPDRPPHALWQYSETAVMPNEPALPEPYTRFDEATAC